MGKHPAAGQAAVCWRVSGRVQGVGFRWFVQNCASRLDVIGDVCNLPDGRVEVRAAGLPAALARLREALRKGPPSSRVDHLEELELTSDLSFQGFNIRRFGASW